MVWCRERGGGRGGSFAAGDNYLTDTRKSSDGRVRVTVAGAGSPGTTEARSPILLRAAEPVGWQGNLP